MEQTEAVPKRIDRDAYNIAKIKAGLRHDVDVAAALSAAAPEANHRKMHPITWTRILTGTYPLTPRVEGLLRTVFGDEDAATFIRPTL